MKSGSEAVTINVPTSPDVTTYNVYRSTSSDRFAQQPDLNVSGGQVSLTVPAQSIVTLTGTGPAAPQPPGQASNPSPADGETGVSTTADLSWTAGSGASSHDVYFGTVTTPRLFITRRLPPMTLARLPTARLTTGASTRSTPTARQPASSGALQPRRRLRHHRVSFWSGTSTTQAAAHHLQPTYSTRTSQLRSHPALQA